MARPLRSGRQQFMNDGTGQHDQYDNRESNPPRRLHVEECPVQGKARYPENQINPADILTAMVLPQDKVIRKEDSRHGRKD